MKSFIQYFSTFVHVIWPLALNHSASLRRCSILHGRIKQHEKTFVPPCGTDFVQFSPGTDKRQCKPGSKDIETIQQFDDYQLHIEFRTPAEVKGTSQGRGNSGIFMQGKYELQVLDNYDNRTYSNGQAGAIYKQTMPLVNACSKPGEWQTYDIVYTSPKFNKDSMIITPAYITVLHNGVLVQNHTPIYGTTPYIGQPHYEVHGKGPIKLQDHDNTTSFRNIWIREL